MACLDNALAVYGEALLFQANGNSPVAAWLPHFPDSFGPAIVDAMGCVDGRAYLIDAFVFQSAMAAVVQPGTVIPAINAGMFSAGGPGIGGSVVLDGVEAATWSYSSDLGFETNASSYVAGVDFQNSFNIIRTIGTEDVTWSIPVSTRLLSFIFESWFCCATAGYDCCSAIGAPKTGFKMPYPEGPREVGDENLSAPPIGTPLYFSNFTSQYVRGMVTKPVKF